MKARKKPVEVEVEQFAVKGGLKAHGIQPGDRFMDWDIQEDDRGYFVIIPTLEGDMRCDENDWVITGVKGEKYPCKPDIFAATYDIV